MGMTVQDIAKQQQNAGSYGDLCKTNLYLVIKSVHPAMTNTDIVRTLALEPVKIALLNLATPQDVALALNIKIHTACKSMILKEIIDYLTQKNIPYEANNDSLAKLGKEVHMTVFEIASLLRKTPTSLLLTPLIELDLLRQEIYERTIEEKVTRMERFASELTKFQPGCNVDLSKLRRILRNYPFEVVRNMSDVAVKRVISSNQIGIFVEKIWLKTVGFFFGRTWQSLRKLRLHEILVDLLGIPCAVFTRRYVDLYDTASLENTTLNQVEKYWNISSVEFTLENLLRASKLMEGEYQCIVCQKYGAACAFRKKV